jgi:hypothetical protein
VEKNRDYLLQFCRNLAIFAQSNNPVHEVMPSDDVICPEVRVEEGELVTANRYDEKCRRAGTLSHSLELKDLVAKTMPYVDVYRSRSATSNGDASVQSAVAGAAVADGKPPTVSSSERAGGDRL